MRRYRNPRAERIKSQQWFYNFCLRLLLERVSHFSYEHAKSEDARNRLLKIIYSERGGHSYGQTIAYQELLKNQAKADALVLAKRRIMWEVLDWRLAEPASHRSSAGAQLADVVASSFYQAIDTLAPTKWNNEFAKLLTAAACVPPELRLILNKIKSNIDDCQEAPNGQNLPDGGDCFSQRAVGK